VSAELSASAPAPHVFTVAEITRAVRAVLEGAFAGEVWVEGEVSNYRKQSSGHQYFTLKDADSQLSCVLFARGVWRKQIPLEDGMQIRARGRLTVYEARGQYQLNVQAVEPAGAGLLQAKFEALKRKLQAEGLFDPARKKPLPPFPATVALVTSPSGAALRDVLTIFSRRAPWIRLIVSPVRVQGEGAAEEIAAAIAECAAWPSLGLPQPDVILVGRGGGSTEDLWEFNEEIVARAIAASPIPIVSAVGHEIDFTICDFAADLRAATPSAAAELIAPDRGELQHRLSQWTARLQRETQNTLDTATQRLDLVGEAMIRATRQRFADLRLWLGERAASLREHRPDQIIRLRRETLANTAAQLAQRFAHAFQRRRERLERLGGHLRLLSPEATLQRGYSITTAADGALVTAPAQLRPGDRIKTQTTGGSFAATVLPDQAPPS
jgi:exodeoxyribonuclease VII large subunit